MSTKMKAAPAFDVVKATLEAFATNDRINAYLIENLSDEVWQAAPPGGKGRTISGIVGHIHNVRLMWLKATGFSGEMPAKLEGDTISRKDATKALASSCLAMRDVLAQSFTSGGKIKGFKPDVASFIAYLFAHDAHHRGQITMLARQMGHSLPKSVTYGIWEWGTR